MTDPRSADWIDGHRAGFEEGYREAIRARIGDATPCRRCCGLGVRGYGSTATYHGGPGGQMLTQDTCDKCWGSGREDRPGLNLKRAAQALLAAESRARKRKGGTS